MPDKLSQLADSVVGAEQVNHIVTIEVAQGDPGAAVWKVPFGICAAIVQRAPYFIESAGLISA